MQPANHHAHSHFSDGRLSPEDYLQNAIKQGLETYGFSDHAPIDLPGVGAMSRETLPKYLAEIDRLKEAYGDQIGIYKSLEVDYIPNVIDAATDYIVAAGLDYVIGAVHFVDYFADGRPWSFESSLENFEKAVLEIFDGKAEAAVIRYYELIRDMVNDQPPDVVAHLDRIKKLNVGDCFFSEQADWYQQAVRKTLETIAAAGCIMEVNTKGLYRNETTEPYPGRWALTQAREMGIPVQLSSDAHHPEDITKGFREAGKLLREVGYEECAVFRQGAWEPVPLAAVYH